LAIKSPDELWPELEKIGEPEVRKQLATRAYAPHNVPVVEEWLRTKEDQRRQHETVSEVSRREQELVINRTSKNAAWVAAIAAIVSIIISIVALFQATR
jgi:hypothetical protein